MKDVWNLVMRSSADRHKRFGVTSCSHLEGRQIKIFALVSSKLKLM